MKGIFNKKTDIVTCGFSAIFFAIEQFCSLLFFLRLRLAVPTKHILSVTLLGCGIVEILLSIFMGHIN